MTGNQKNLLRGLAVFCALVIAAKLFWDPSKRSIGGGYELERWEDGQTYYLLRGGKEAIEGTVEEIGWNERFILVRRHASFRGDPDGWMILDQQSQDVRGPSSDTDIRTLPEARDIKVSPPELAWDQ